MDVDEIATEQEQFARDMALSTKKPEGPQATGKCLWCEESLEGRRWCNAECRGDWEKYKKNA